MEDSIMADSVLSQLKGLSKDWHRVKPKESGGGFQRVPDGNYQVICKQARLENAKSSGRLQIAWMFRVLSGDQKGKPIYVYQGLDSENNLSWVKGVIKALGVEPPNVVTNLPSRLEKCLEKKANATCATQGDFNNTYITAWGSSKKAEDDEDMEALEDLEDEEDDEDDDEELEEEEDEPVVRKKKKVRR
jgi:hypothetical protein